MAGIKHRITTIEKIDVKDALVKDDLTILVDDNEEPIDIRVFLKRFVGKLINFSLSEKTEEEVEEEYIDENDEVDFDE